MHATSAQVPARCHLHHGDDADSHSVLRQVRGFPVCRPEPDPETVSAVPQLVGLTHGILCLQILVPGAACPGIFDLLRMDSPHRALDLHRDGRGMWRRQSAGGEMWPASAGACAIAVRGAIAG